ncbi:phosphatase PAP2 family protein [Streptomyces tubbatahanensis]|uniref:Phosphatase PAP2 family protein n=1 Tax=Streptomyces tubbatahanensis TaxID=2923272 RepID=A0ABY3XUR5_9ACTN|nr:phosphatase PAP2 family protein [Streptomyces tubbatahanensis]UNS98109.1 phosphatase PAP2 family protein [Streptomyces tubbatahanensis]
MSGRSTPGSPHSTADGATGDAAGDASGNAPHDASGNAAGDASEALDPRGLLRQLAPVAVPVPAGSEVRRAGKGPRRARPLPLVAGLLAGLVLFAGVTYLALGVGAGFVDRPVLGEVVRHRLAALDGPVTVATHASKVPLLAASVLVALWLSWRQGSWAPVALVGATGALAVAAATVVKEVTDRSRPPAKLWAVQEDGFCYPSRHTVIATAVLLILAYVLTARIASRPARVALWAGAGALSVLAGLSRLYLGVHWPTDVVAGLVLGASVPLVVVTVYALRAGHPHARHP